MSKRYGLLPSELIKRGSTLDIQLALLSQEYKSYLKEKYEKGEHITDNHGLSEDQMMSMIEKVNKNAG